MAMSMRLAFGSQMLTKVTHYKVGESYYDDNNEIVKGHVSESIIYGVIKAGNRFSQFDVGIALQATESGERLSDYRSLYLTSDYEVSMNDKFGYEGGYFTIIQQSRELTYSFLGLLIEKSKVWRPYDS
jgi:hypothetical protein